MPDSSDSRRKSPPRKTYEPCHLAGWRTYIDATQQEMADYIGFSKSHVSSVETGARPWSQEFLEAAVEFFRSRGVGVSAGDIVDMDPLEPVQNEVWLLARRVPPEKREAAAAMLRGLNMQREPATQQAGRLPRRRSRVKR